MAQLQAKFKSECLNTWRRTMVTLTVCGKYSLRHRKCGVRGFIHERAGYERVRAFDTTSELNPHYKALSMS